MRMGALLRLVARERRNFRSPSLEEAIRLKKPDGLVVTVHVRMDAVDPRRREVPHLRLDDGVQISVWDD
jgi:hypothetical protein